MINLVCQAEACGMYFKLRKITPANLFKYRLRAKDAKRYGLNRVNMITSIRNHSP